MTTRNPIRLISAAPMAARTFGGRTRVSRIPVGVARLTPTETIPGVSSA